MATNAQKGNPLTEFATTIPLFQKKRQLTFNGSTNSEQRYRADFVLDGFDLKGTVILSSRLNEFERSFINEKKSAPLTLFSKMNLYLNKMPAKPRTQPARYILELEYSKDNLDLEQVPGTSFRNWPEDMVLNLVSQKLFQRAAEESIRTKKNSLFVEILETMKIEELLENPDPGKCNTIFKSLLSAFEKMGTNPFGGSSLWQSQKMWVDVLENCIQTDIPIKEVAAFYLATGRFPKRKELGLEKKKLVIEGPER